MKFILLAAMVGLVRCHRPETKSRRCKGQPSATQLSQLAQDAHQLLGLANKELHTAASQNAGGVAHHDSEMPYSGTQRKKMAYLHQQEKYDEREVSDAAEALPEDVEGFDKERSQILENMDDDEDPEWSTNEAGTDVVEDKFGRAHESLLAQDKKLSDGNGSTSPEPDLEEFNDINDVKETTDADTTSSTILPENTPDSTYFHDLPQKQAQLKQAHEQLQQVATQANGLATKAYEDVKAYKQTVENLNAPMQEVRKTVDEFHSKLEDSIRSGESERLQAWTDLHTELKNAGVDDDTS